MSGRSDKGGVNEKKGGWVGTKNNKKCELTQHVDGVGWGGCGAEW